MSEGAIVVYEASTIEPPTAGLLVGAVEVGLVAALFVCLRATGRARRALQRARASIVPGAALEEGQRFVSGRVELAAGEDVAVRVTVTQTGVERAVKNGHVHDWREIDREVVARPFYLVHESGERVRVEVPPPEGVQLVDRLDQAEWTERHTRRKRAAVTEGETAFVEGRLERGHDPEGGASAGYRDAALGWVVRPRRGVLAVSTEPLDHRHALRLRALDRLFLVLVVALIALQAPLAGFLARALGGVDATVAYIGKRSYSTLDSKGRSTRHDAVDHAMPGGAEQRTAEVSHADYEALPEGPGQIALRYVPARPAASALGRGSSIHVVTWTLAALIAGVALRRAWRVTTHKRWYERPLVETGCSGRLPDPTGERFPS